MRLDRVTIGYEDTGSGAPELDVIDGAAHLPNLERPAEFNATLERFLETLPAQVATEGHA
jgi:pimeloyl-ACP methyl ester carboxylesterase